MNHTSAKDFISPTSTSFFCFPCCDGSSLTSKSLNDEHDDPFEADASLSLPLSSKIHCNENYFNLGQGQGNYVLIVFHKLDAIYILFHTILYYRPVAVFASDALIPRMRFAAFITESFHTDNLLLFKLPLNL